MKEFCVKKKLFGKEIEIVLNGIAPFLCEEIVEDVYDYGLKLQKIFNFFDENSELSRLNKKRSLNVSDDFIHVIKKALRLCELTNGQYDVTIGKQIFQRKKGFQIKTVNCSYKNIEIKGNKVILTHEDVIVDLGSIAKGYITDKMVEHLISKGVLSCLIDARGDIRVFGKEFKLIEVQHPRDKDNVIYVIKIKNLSVATSGDYNQHYGSFDKPHIINKKDLVSVTVIAQTLEEADVYATALFVLDEKERIKFIRQNKNIKVSTVDSNLNIKYYNNFRAVICRDKK